MICCCSPPAFHPEHRRTVLSTLSSISIPLPMRKGVSVVMLMLGVGAGGLVDRASLVVLIIGGTGPVSNLAFAWLATQGPDPGATRHAVDNVSAGYAGTILGIAYVILTSAGFLRPVRRCSPRCIRFPASWSRAVGPDRRDGRADGGAGGALSAGLAGRCPTCRRLRFPRGAYAASVFPWPALAASYAIFFFCSWSALAALVLALVIAGRQMRVLLRLAGERRRLLDANAAGRATMRRSAIRAAVRWPTPPWWQDARNRTLAPAFPAH